MIFIEQFCFGFPAQNYSHFKYLVSYEFLLRISIHFPEKRIKKTFSSFLKTNSIKIKVSSFTKKSYDLGRDFIQKSRIRL
jgi:hypothetical protein